MIEAVGQELRQLREQAGLSLTQVTVRTGLSPNYIHKLETGSRSNPSPEVIRKLSGAYGVKYLWLLERLGVIERRDILDYQVADVDFNLVNDAAGLLRAAD